MTKEARIYNREKTVSSIQSLRLKDILESYLWPLSGKEQMLSPRQVSESVEVLISGKKISIELPGADLSLLLLFSH